MCVSCTKNIYVFSCALTNSLPKTIYYRISYYTTVLQYGIFVSKLTLLEL